MITLVITVPVRVSITVLTAELFLRARRARVSRIVSILLLLLLTGNFCYGQSLGDVARQNQKDKQQKEAAAKKVYTTDDVSPIATPKPPATPADPTKPAAPKTYDKLGYASFTPEMWTRTIKAQKDWIAYLQKEAEQLKTPPKFDRNKAATDPEARKYWESRDIQQQYASEIPGEQKKLNELQIEAQRAGMPTSVWDPQ